MWKNKQNTSTIYQVSVAAFFVVVATNIDIFEQILIKILTKIYFKMHQIPHFFPREHVPIPLLQIHDFRSFYA